MTMTAEQVSAAASITTVVLAIVAILVAKKQITESRSIARESTATNLYNKCLELSLQYPKLAEPALSGGFNELVKHPHCAACYHWFVASLMLSCEEILAVTENDPKWRASVYATLDGHAEYFRYRNTGSRPLCDFYSDQLVKLVTEIVDDTKNPPEALAIKMSEKANA